MTSKGCCRDGAREAAISLGEMSKFRNLVGLHQYFIQWSPVGEDILQQHNGGFAGHDAFGPLGLEMGASRITFGAALLGSAAIVSLPSFLKGRLPPSLSPVLSPSLRAVRAAWARRRLSGLRVGLPSSPPWRLDLELLFWEVLLAVGRLRGALPASDILLIFDP